MVNPTTDTMTCIVGIIVLGILIMSQQDLVRIEIENNQCNCLLDVFNKIQCTRIEYIVNCNFMSIARKQMAIKIHDKRNNINKL